MVQPEPTPDSTIPEASRRTSDSGISQKLKLFNLGKAVSGAPNNAGKNKLPQPAKSK
jgi:hypothetical protein